MHVLGVGGSAGAIVSGVNLSLQAGVLTAILGPSGSGKSTLLTKLCFRNPSVEVVQGSMMARVHAEPSEGRPRPRDASPSFPVSSVVREVAFCPQHDALHTDLTPRLTVRVHSALRGDPQCPAQMQDKRVADVLRGLGLGHVADCVIKKPGAVKGGLSGGEQRRLSLGCEVVTTPAILACDEPTSGVDSAGALAISLLLRELARAGELVVAVLHQPRTEVLAVFDDVVIMTPYGQVMYAGPRGLLRKYITECLGFSVVPSANIADVALDIVAGVLNTPALSDRAEVHAWRYTSLLRRPSAARAARALGIPVSRRSSPTAATKEERALLRWDGRPESLGAFFSAAGSRWVLRERVRKALGRMRTLQRLAIAALAVLEARASNWVLRKNMKYASAATRSSSATGRAFARFAARDGSGSGTDMPGRDLGPSASAPGASTSTSTGRQAGKTPSPVRTSSGFRPTSVALSDVVEHAEDIEEDSDEDSADAKEAGGPHGADEHASGEAVVTGARPSLGEVESTSEVEAGALGWLASPATATAASSREASHIREIKSLVNDVCVCVSLYKVGTLVRQAAERITRAKTAESRGGALQPNPLTSLHDAVKETLLCDAVRGMLHEPEPQAPDEKAAAVEVVTDGARGSDKASPDISTASPAAASSSQRQQAGARDSTSPPVGSTADSETSRSVKDGLAFDSRPAVPWIRQFGWLLARDMWLVYAARPRQVAIRLLLTALIAAICGFLYDDLSNLFRSGEWIWLTCMAAGFIGTTNALPHVMEERDIIQREVYAGISRSAFALAKIVAFLPLLTINALLLTACSVVFADTIVLGFGYVFAMHLLVLLQSSAVGHLIGVAMTEPASAQLFAVLVALFCPILAGLRPPVEELQDMGWVVDGLSQLTWSRHSFAGGWCTEASVFGAAAGLPTSVALQVFGHDCFDILANYGVRVVLPQLSITLVAFGLYVAINMSYGMGACQLPSCPRRAK